MVEGFNGPRFVVCKVMKGGVVALEEGLDGPLFQNGLERGQGAVERACMIHQLGGGGG